MENNETIETIEIENLVNMYNNGMTLQSISQTLGSSKSAVQRKLVKNGYIFNKITKKYENNVSIETINQEKPVSNKSKVSSATSVTENVVNRTYAISEKTDRGIKLKAIIECKKPIDVVREALEAYIEAKYLEM